MWLPWWFTWFNSFVGPSKQQFRNALCRRGAEPSPSGKSDIASIIGKSYLRDHSCGNGFLKRGGLHLPLFDLPPLHFINHFKVTYLSHNARFSSLTLFNKGAMILALIIYLLDNQALDFIGIDGFLFICRKVHDSFHALLHCMF